MAWASTAAVSPRPQTFLSLVAPGSATAITEGGRPSRGREQPGPPARWKRSRPPLTVAETAGSSTQEPARTGALLARIAAPKACLAGRMPVAASHLPTATTPPFQTSRHPQPSRNRRRPPPGAAPPSGVYRGDSPHRQSHRSPSPTAAVAVVVAALPRVRPARQDAGDTAGRQPSRCQGRAHRHPSRRHLRARVVGHGPNLRRGEGRRAK